MEKKAVDVLCCVGYKGGAMTKRILKIKQLCWTDRTLYAVDEGWYVWYIDLKTGEWALHGNPTFEDRAKLLKG